MAKLRIATAQFPVAASIARNLRDMRRLIAEAKEQRADVVHFSETCLGGYAGVEFKSWDRYDWSALKTADTDLLQLALEMRIGLVYGTNHRVADDDVRNALVYVSAEGKRVARYDKRFCTGGDLKYYRSGRRFVTFEIKGFTCGLLICYDVRFPELYRACKQRGVQVLFQSFYNARRQGANIHTTIMRPSLQAHAATNYFYISANNSSGYYQSWPSVFVLPNGEIKASCRQHRAGLMVNEIDNKYEFYDAASADRERAMAGVLYSE